MLDLVYLACASALILGLKLMGAPRTARRGNLLAGLGMLVAVVATLVAAEVLSWTTIVIGLAVGTAIGVVWARQVAMTAMPQMVALLNGLGGLASGLVAAAELVTAGDPAVLRLDVQVTIVVSLAVGAMTFTGSVAAFGKLQDLIPGRALVYRGQAATSVLVTLAAAAAALAALLTAEAWGHWAVAAIALLIGVLMVLPVGGADMPVIVSMLNSFSGLAAAATGFVIGNSALVIGGALVGSAGFILTVLMCEAMNRSLANVLFGAFRAPEAAAAAAQTDQAVRAATPEDVAIALAYAQRVLIVPGYGLAVAQAQHDVRKLAAELEMRGVEVAYAIHPVAGRMPGHMNVLLAEADVPYEQLLDLDQSNEFAARADTVVVLGANDVVNPSARDDPGSAIYGMPIIEADRASTVVVVKRSLSPGYAGIDNPLFYAEGTMMFFDDAKRALERVTAALSLV